MATTRRKNNVKRRPPKGYDSWLEYEIHQIKDKWEHHPSRITYTQVKEYEPDFCFVQDDSWTIYVEVKGRFRDRAEARKYVDVKASLSPFEELIFIFQDPKKPMPNARRRKDGTIYTHGEWAEKHGFEYYSMETLNDVDNA